MYILSKSLPAKIIVALLGLGYSVVSQALPFLVHSGYDLLTTLQAQIDFDGEGSRSPDQFESLPFGRFDFGDGQGPVKTYNTDTILRRLEDATRSSEDSGPADENPIALEFIDLSIISVAPIADFFGGASGRHIVATNINDLGSTMEIFFDSTGTGGTFNSELKFQFDLVEVLQRGPTLEDTILGNVLGTFDISELDGALSQTGAVWSQDPNKIALDCEGVIVPLLIPGINDKHFFTCVADHFSRFPEHRTVTASVNEPMSLILLSLGFGLLAYNCRRKAI